MPNFIGSYWFLSLSVFIAVVLSITGLLLVRRYVAHDELTTHHDVAGSFLSIVGTLYAVVLGFIVVASLNSFDKARLDVEQEANSLHDIFHLTRGMPSEQGHKLRQLCLDYAECMVNEEWACMEQGVESQKAHQIAVAIWDNVIGFQPRESGQQDVHSSLLSQMNDLGDARRERLMASTPTYDKVVWLVLLLGATVTIVFTYFFGVENLGTQMIMTGLVTIILSLNLVLVAMFGYPFSGDVKVPSVAFERDLLRFREDMQRIP